MLLIDEILENQDLLKLINYNSTRPLGEPDIVRTGALVMNKIIPAPVTQEVPLVEQTNLRVFFPYGHLKNRVVLDSTLVFQVVLHKNLWNIYRPNGEKAIRPYEIMNEIVNTFEDKTIKSLGVIHFKNYRYGDIDKDYGVYNLEAVVTTI